MNATMMTRPDPVPALSTPAVAVEIEGVNLSYGDHHVLKNVDLAIRPGEFFAFLGPSGCGKTTLLRLIAGFNQADSGRVTIGGKDISSLPPWKRDVGMVFQSYALWPHMTVRRNVAFGLEEREELARPDREVDVFQDVVFAIGEVHPLDLDGDGGRRERSSRVGLRHDGRVHQ